MMELKQSMRLSVFYFSAGRWRLGEDVPGYNLVHLWLHLRLGDLDCGLYHCTKFGTALPFVSEFHSIVSPCPGGWICNQGHAGFSVLPLANVYHRFAHHSVVRFFSALKSHPTHHLVLGRFYVCASLCLLHIGCSLHSKGLFLLNTDIIIYTQGNVYLRKSKWC